MEQVSEAIQRHHERKMNNVDEAVKDASKSFWIGQIDQNKVDEVEGLGDISVIYLELLGQTEIFIV